MAGVGGVSTAISGRTGGGLNDDTVAEELPVAARHRVGVDDPVVVVRPFDVAEDDEVTRRREACRGVRPAGDPRHDDADRSGDSDPFDSTPTP